jgi:hypothetical protein
MKSDTNTAANVGPGVQTEDFAQWVRVNQAKLTPELRPHYDFMVFGEPVGSRSQGAVPRLTHAGPAEEIVGKELIARSFWFPLLGRISSNNERALFCCRVHLSLHSFQNPIV